MRNQHLASFFERRERESERKRAEEAGRENQAPSEKSPRARSCFYAGREWWVIPSKYAPNEPLAWSIYCQTEWVCRAEDLASAAQFIRWHALIMGLTGAADTGQPKFGTAEHAENAE